jgi:hypothetical protein
MKLDHDLLKGRIQNFTIYSSCFDCSSKINKNQKDIMIKAIIFDLNGTLDNTDKAFTTAFFLTLKNFLPTRKNKELEIFARELLVFFWQQTNC